MNMAEAFAYRPSRWPAIVVIMATLGGLAMLVVAALLHWRSADVISKLDTDTPAPTVAPARDRFGNDPLFSLAPPATSRLADIRTIYEIAGERHVALASVDYHSETQSKAGLLLEHLDLRLDDEYSKVKLLMAQLLHTLPNLLIDEVDLQDAASGATTARIRATLKLTLVYQAVESAPKSDKAASRP